MDLGVQPSVVVVSHRAGCRADVASLEPIISRSSIPRFGRASLLHRLLFSEAMPHGSGDPSHVGRLFTMWTLKSPARKGTTIGTTGHGERVRRAAWVTREARLVFERARPSKRGEP